MLSNNKKIFSFLLVLAGCFLTLPVLAQTGLMEEVFTDSGIATTATLPQIIARFVQIFLGLLGVVAIILVMYGGFIWMTAGGDPEKVNKAKRILTSAVIGLVIIFSAFAIATFVIGALRQATDGNDWEGRSCETIGESRPCGTRSACNDYQVCELQEDDSLRWGPCIREVDCVLGPGFNDDEFLNIFEFNDPESSFRRVWNYRSIRSGTLQLPADTDLQVSVYGHRPVSAGEYGEDFISLYSVDDEAEEENLSYFVNSETSQFTRGATTFNSVIAKSDLTTDFRGILNFRAGYNDFRSSDIRVRIWPKHCFNGIQDEDETGIDCGGSCANCDGTTCKRIDNDTCSNDNCSSGVCNTATCLCGTAPTITYVSPALDVEEDTNLANIRSEDIDDDIANGAIGSYISIFGRGFGTVSGTVSFINKDNRFTVTAQLAPCVRNWTNNQIVVVIPEGLSELNITNETGIESGETNYEIIISTGNNIDSNLWDFQVNKINRPGLCTADPARGVNPATTTLFGFNFPSGTSSREVTWGVGATAITSTFATGWTTTTVIDTVPANRRGRSSIRIFNGNSYSNSILFNISAGRLGDPCGYDSAVCNQDINTCLEDLVCGENCSCIRAPIIDTCTTGSTTPCFIGGCTGEQTCNSEGRWGACVSTDPNCIPYLGNNATLALFGWAFSAQKTPRAGMSCASELWGDSTCDLNGCLSNELYCETAGSDSGFVEIYNPTNNEGEVTLCVDDVCDTSVNISSNSYYVKNLPIKSGGYDSFTIEQKSVYNAPLNAWQSVTYGDGKFVAVASDGTDRVMISDDGITWTSYGIANGIPLNAWQSVTYGDGKFVAVASDGTDRVMISDDGINWDSYGITNGIPLNAWQSVTYGDGKFVAVASGGENRAMMSVDGINWDSYGITNGIPLNAWQSVTYGDGKFVAVASGGTNRVMVLSDIDNNTKWIVYSSIISNSWQSVTYGDGKFVAVPLNDFRLLFSEYNIDWGLIGSGQRSDWISITYGGGRFLVVGLDKYLISKNGIDWQVFDAPENTNWQSVIYGAGKFVAVANSGTNRVVNYIFDTFSLTSTTSAYYPNSFGRVRDGEIGEMIYFASATPETANDSEVSSNLADRPVINEISLGFKPCTCMPKGNFCSPGEIDTTTCEPNGQCRLVRTCRSSGHWSQCVQEDPNCVPYPLVPASTIATYAWSFSADNTPNLKDFMVITDCSGTLNCSNDENLPSPSPWSYRFTSTSHSRLVQEADACINAVISARFTAPLDVTTLDTNSIKLYQQTQAGWATVTDYFIDDDIATSTSRGEGGADYFKIQPVGRTLKPSSTYMVALNKTMIKDELGRLLMDDPSGVNQTLCKDPVDDNNHVCWKFDTRASDKLCDVGCVHCTPKNYFNRYFGQEKKHLSTPISDDNVCLVLNSTSYGWDWSVEHQDSPPTFATPTVATAYSLIENGVDFSQSPGKRTSGQATTTAKRETRWRDVDEDINYFTYYDNSKPTNDYDKYYFRITAKEQAGSQTGYCPVHNNFIDPIVIENQYCTRNPNDPLSNVMQSPSPWKGQQDACINAVVFVLFSRNMQNTSLITPHNTSNLSHGTTTANIAVYSCPTEAQATSSSGTTGCTKVSGNWDAKIFSYNQSHLTLNDLENFGESSTSSPEGIRLFPNGNFTTSTWYKVVITGGMNGVRGGVTEGAEEKAEGVLKITSQNTKMLTNGDESYYWYFRTGAEECPVEDVIVLPQRKFMSRVGLNQDYEADPWANNCNHLNPFNYVWQWRSTFNLFAFNCGDDSDATTLVRLCDFNAQSCTTNNDGLTYPFIKAFGVGEGNVKIHALAKDTGPNAGCTDDKSGYGDLQIGTGDFVINRNFNTDYLQPDIFAYFSRNLLKASLDEDDFLDSNSNVRLYDCGTDESCLVTSTSGNALEDLNLIYPTSTSPEDSYLHFKSSNTLSTTSFYRLLIMGGEDGVKSITNNKISNPNYNFSGIKGGEECDTGVYPWRDGDSDYAYCRTATGVEGTFDPDVDLCSTLSQQCDNTDKISAYYDFNGLIFNRAGRIGLENYISESTTDFEINGRSGQALNFGGNDYVQLSQDILSNSIGTIAFWVKQRSREQEKNILGVINGAENIKVKTVFDNSGDKFKIEGSGINFTTPQIFTFGNWHHLALTYDSGNLDFYVNGQLKSSNPYYHYSYLGSDAVDINTNTSTPRHFIPISDDSIITYWDMSSETTQSQEPIIYKVNLDEDVPVQYILELKTANTWQTNVNGNRKDISEIFPNNYSGDVGSCVQGDDLQGNRLLHKIKVTISNDSCLQYLDPTLCNAPKNRSIIAGNPSNPTLTKIPVILLPGDNEIKIEWLNDCNCLSDEFYESENVSFRCEQYRENQWIDSNLRLYGLKLYPPFIQLILGNSATNGVDGFRGDIDELVVYQKALSASEVSSLYSSVYPKDVLYGCDIKCQNLGNNFTSTTVGIPEDMPICGNGKIEMGEDCDDGESNGDTGCSENCTWAGSGDDADPTNEILERGDQFDSYSWVFQVTDRIPVYAKTNPCPNGIWSIFADQYTNNLKATIYQGSIEDTGGCTSDEEFKNLGFWRSILNKLVNIVKRFLGFNTATAAAYWCPIANFPQTFNSDDLANMRKGNYVKNVGGYEFIGYTDNNDYHVIRIINDNNWAKAEYKLKLDYTRFNHSVASSTSSVEVKADVCELDRVRFDVWPRGRSKTRDAFFCFSDGSATSPDDCGRYTPDLYDDDMSAVWTENYPDNGYNLKADGSVGLAGNYKTGNNHLYRVWAQDENRYLVKATITSEATAVSGNTGLEILHNAGNFLQTNYTGDFWVTGGAQEGRDIISVTATDNTATTEGEIVVQTFFCKNPWPDPDNFPFMDSSGNCTTGLNNCLNSNFATFYCRDAGIDQACISTSPNSGRPCSKDSDCGTDIAGSCVIYTTDDLPEINPTSISEAESPITKDIVFGNIDRNDTSDVIDAIALRVYQNPNHFSPTLWYREQFNTEANLTELVVDGNKAVREGRTVYVNAPDFKGDWNKVYTNIYLLSYNQEPAPTTFNIYNQLLNNIYFNASSSDGGLESLTRIGNCVDINYNVVGGDKCFADLDCIKRGHRYCLSDKAKITRDAIRLSDAQDIFVGLNRYHNQKRCSNDFERVCTEDSGCYGGGICANYYPNLKAGTYMAGNTFSTWPSWQNELGRLIGIKMPVDPINRFFSNSNKITLIPRGEIKGWESIAMSDDGKYQTAVVYEGMVYVSEDYGINWSPKVNDNNRPWVSVAMSADGQYQIVAVDQRPTVNQGAIYISEDYGQNWSLISNTNENWMSVSVSSDKTVLKAVTAVPGGGFIYKFSDSSNSFGAMIRFKKNFVSIAMSADGKHQTAVTKNDKIYVSENYGSDWTEKNENRDWKSIAMSADGKYQTAVASNTSPFVSDDWGQTWQQSLNVENGGARPWTSAAMSADGKHQVIVGESVNMRVSTDYGKNWLIVNSMAKNWRSVAISADGSYITAVANGDKIYTHNISDRGCSDPYNSQTCWSETKKKMKCLNDDWLYYRYQATVSTSPGLIIGEIGRIYSRPEMNANWGTSWDDVTNFNSEYNPFDNISIIGCDNN